MSWARGSAYHEESADGKYRVSAARVNEGWRFTGWKVGKHGWIHLGTFRTAEEARRLCETEMAAEQVTA